MSSEVNKGTPAAASTARHLEDLILEGSLRPGDPLLPEREMALRLKVSRPTLRQGIKMLEDKGLIVADQNGGRQVAMLATSVTDPLIELMASRAETVDDYLELRAALEGLAAGLAATRANDVDRETLSRCIERIEAAHHDADPNDEAEVAECEKLNDEIVALALSMDGTCTGEHGIGDGKQKYLLSEVGIEAVGAMRAIKQALDPQGVMNPGKIF